MPHGPFDPAELRRVGAWSEQTLLALPSTATSSLPRLPFRLESEAIFVSALRPTDDGTAFLLRLYNPSAAAARGRVVGTGTASIRLTESDERGQAGKLVGAESDTAAARSNDAASGSGEEPSEVKVARSCEAAKW